MAKDTIQSSLTHGLTRLCTIHFAFVLAFVSSIIVYDASQLIAPDAVLYRWKLAVLMTVIVTTAWYLARDKKDNKSLQRWLVALLVLTDIVFVSLLVYADRGMASLGIALYAVPIVTSAILLSRSAILATAALCLAGYSYATVKYFVDFFNEGYKVQLYSAIGFYGVTFFVLAALLITVIQRKKVS